MSKDQRKYTLVTVGVPTYNGGSRISKALTSVLDQEYPNLELVISDNCSTDHTMEVCMELGRRNPCIRYYRQSRSICAKQNFEFVLQQARGDFFMWLPDDDFLEKGILTKYAGFLFNHPEYALVSGKIRYWIGDQTIFCDQDFNLEQDAAMARLIGLYAKTVCGSAVHGLMRREVANRIPIMDRTGADWHFVASIAYLGKIKNLNCVGFNKECRDLSKDLHPGVKDMGNTSFAEQYPYVRIALDAYSNILHDSPVFARLNAAKKFVLASSSFLTILLNFYARQYPFILGAKIRKLVRLSASGIISR